VHYILHTFAFQKCPLYLWAVRIFYPFSRRHSGAWLRFFGSSFQLVS
jgi:hypothetical protein